VLGCQRPHGFTATKDEYVDWSAGELHQFDDHVDLVGSDWGAGLTLRLATHPDRPVGLRSWAIDVANEERAGIYEMFGARTVELEGWVTGGRWKILLRTRGSPTRGALTRCGLRRRAGRG